MSVVNSVVSTLFVVVFLSITLALNETVYSNTDLSKSLDLSANATVNCIYGYGNNDLQTLAKAPFGESDEIAREALYGSFSARGASVAVYLLGVVALALGLLRQRTVSLLKKVEIEIFNLVVTGVVLASSLLVANIVLALTDQSYVPSGVLKVGALENLRNLDVCGDADSVVQRSEKLQAALVFGLVTLFSIAYMVRELHLYNDELDKEDKEKKVISNPLADVEVGDKE